MSDDEIEREFVRVTALPGFTRIYVRIIDWPSPHTPVSSWVLAAEVDALPEPAVVELHRRRVLADRLYFGRCAECGELKPAGWMHNAAICQGCAEQNHGVVH